MGDINHKMVLVAPPASEALPAVPAAAVSVDLLDVQVPPASAAPHIVPAPPSSAASTASAAPQQKEPVYIETNF